MFKEFELTGTEVMEFRPRPNRITIADYALYFVAAAVFLGFCFLVSQHI
jgi:hypothetical protein